jgi:monoamine oxidase
MEEGRSGLDRRSFLRTTAMGVVAGTAALADKSDAASKRRPHPSRSADVLVVGAGMAGVTAARTLYDKGHRVIVLEGRPDRVGGRIWTSRAWPDAPVDLGASWLTHETINPLADIAKFYGVKTVPSNLGDVSLREANGQVLSAAEVEELWSLYLANYGAVKFAGLDRSARGLPDIPASQAFAKIADWERLDANTRRRLGFFLDYAIQNPECASLSDLSLKNWDDDFVFVQAFTSVFPNGYGQLVDILAAPLDIRLNQNVREIDYGPSGVTVVTNQGSFSAPYAIVTLPHAVLSSGVVKFTPTLPPWKRGAINRLKTGLTDKFYFRFPSRFWDPSATTVGRIPPTLDAGWSTWLNFYKYTGMPILMVFNHTGLAHQLEAMSDTQVIDAAMRVLRNAYGAGIPDPIGLQRSRWAANPFARGTYPHVQPGVDENDYAVMGQPVGPVRFAGDSTDREFPTLVFGAFRSGLREAIAVDALLL